VQRNAEQCEAWQSSKLTRLIANVGIYLIKPIQWIRLGAEGAGSVTGSGRMTGRTQRLEEKREMGLIYQTLGSKEMDIWTHVAQGLSNKQIGRELGMTEGNVEWWVSQLLLRFEVQNRVQLAKMHWSNQQVNIKGL